MTYADQLAEFIAARSRILAGQMYKMPDGRQLQRADLDVVNREIHRLEALAAREARGGGMNVRLGTPSRF